MTTDNETWRDASSAAENSGAEREENQSNNENGSARASYNRDGGSRPYRPRFINENGGRPQRAYSSDRSYRPRFNPNADNGGDRPQRVYTNDRSYNNERSYNNDRSYNSDRSFNSDRPYRPRFNPNSENGNERPQRPYRPQQRPYGNEQRSYRPRFNPNADNGNERPQRSYNSERPAYGNADRSLRPRYNSYNNDSYGEHPQRSYGNNQGRPRFNANNGGRPSYGNAPRRRPAGYDPNAKYNKKKQIEYKEQFVDPNEPIRLNKFLANAGVCSRREADEFITAGVVSVNGQVITELGTKIKRGDEVKFHDQLVSIERKIYILLNKPKDTVTTSDDPQARRTVMDLVKGACPERIYPVGRLDRNTTGVLLLTNDGDLASKLTHPKYLKKKIYHVRLDKNLTKGDMEKIAAGIELDDGEIRADAISYTDETKKNDVGIEIHSGKNRIVRRIFESLGYKVVKLDRVYFAGLTKKGLRRGEWRFLTEQEVNFLRMGSFE